MVVSFRECTSLGKPPHDQEPFLRVSTMCCIFPNHPGFLATTILASTHGPGIHTYFVPLDICGGPTSIYQFVENQCPKDPDMFSRTSPTILFVGDEIGTILRFPRFLPRPFSHRHLQQIQIIIIEVDLGDYSDLKSWEAP